MACLFMVACTNNSNNGQKEEQAPAAPEQTCDQQKPCPFTEIETLFADWDNMNDEAKAEAVKAAKAKFDEMEACHHKDQCKEGGEKPCCKEGKPEMKSCCPKCVEGCCKDGKCICENCTCECMKDGKCTMEEGKPCCKPQCPEMTEEMKAKCAEMCEKWANFDNLSIEDQKAAIEGRLEMMKQCPKGPKGPECNKPCEKPCDKPAE